MEASISNLLLVPPICTATLYCSAETPSGYLRDRVAEIVTANTWLSGRLCQEGCGPFLASQASAAGAPGHFLESKLSLPSSSVSETGNGKAACPCPAQECRSALPITESLSCSDLLCHVQQIPGATIACGLAAINRDEVLFKVAVVHTEHPEYFILVVSLNHTIGDVPALKRRG
eukprot:s3244_g8.t1